MVAGVGVGSRSYKLPILGQMTCRTEERRGKNRFVLRNKVWPEYSKPLIILQQAQPRSDIVAPFMQDVAERNVDAGGGNYSDTAIGSGAVEQLLRVDPGGGVRVPELAGIPIFGEDVHGQPAIRRRFVGVFSCLQLQIFEGFHVRVLFCGEVGKELEGVGR